MRTYDKPPELAAWMTVGELALFLGKSRQTLERWLRSGKLPPPATTTPNGWRLWSPQQTTDILGVVSRRTSL